MKPNPKWTAATLLVLAAATVPTMHALAIAPVPMVHESGGASATGSKTYDEWQTPLSRSFRARFLDHRTAGDSIVGGVPGHSFTLRIFDGLEKIQIWDNAP
jgi:hypothetical protein